MPAGPSLNPTPNLMHASATWAVPKTVGNAIASVIDSSVIDHAAVDASTASFLEIAPQSDSKAARFLDIELRIKKQVCEPVGMVPAVSEILCPGSY